MFDIKTINPAHYLKHVSKMQFYDNFTVGSLKEGFMDNNVSLSNIKHLPFS